MKIVNMIMKKILIINVAFLYTLIATAQLLCGKISKLFPMNLNVKIVI